MLWVDTGHAMGGYRSHRPTRGHNPPSAPQGRGGDTECHPGLCAVSVPPMHPTADASDFIFINDAARPCLGRLVLMNRIDDALVASAQCHPGRHGAMLWSHPRVQSSDHALGDTLPRGIVRVKGHRMHPWARREECSIPVGAVERDCSIRVGAAERHCSTPVGAAERDCSIRVGAAERDCSIRVGAAERDPDQPRQPTMPLPFGPPEPRAVTGCRD